MVCLVELSGNWVITGKLGILLLVAEGVYCHGGTDMEGSGEYLGE